MDYGLAMLIIKVIRLSLISYDEMHTTAKALFTDTWETIWPFIQIIIKKASNQRKCIKWTRIENVFPCGQRILINSGLNQFKFLEIRLGTPEADSA